MKKILNSKQKILWLFIIIFVCFISFEGSIIAKYKKGPYRSSDQFINDTVSTRGFHVDVTVVYYNQEYLHQIDVNQVNNIHKIYSSDNSNYVANYETGDLTTGDLVFHIPMAKVTDIFTLLENAKESTQVSSTEKDYVISKETINDYLLNLSVNLINDGSYAYPMAEEDVHVQVYKIDKYLNKIFLKLCDDLSIEYDFSNYNEIGEKRETPPVDLPNPNILEETIDFSTWDFFKQV